MEPLVSSSKLTGQYAMALASMTLIFFSRHFLIADDAAGILVISYEVRWQGVESPSSDLTSHLQGRVVSTIKSSGLSSVNPQTVAISVDTVAIRERRDEKSEC